MLTELTCSRPEECIRPSSVVGEILDEKGGLVEGVDDSAHSVVQVDQRPNPHALQVSA